IREDSTVIDIGANIGSLTLPLAKLVPNGTVYAFEPTSYALERLIRNLELNPELAKRVRVINSFVSERSDTNPEIVAYSSWKVNGERGSRDHPVHLGTPKSSNGVPSVSLDDFVDKQCFQKIDLIKIDTVGHEYEILKGAKMAIAKYRPAIIFEMSLYA